MDSLAAEILYKNIKFEYFILLYLILYILEIQMKYRKKKAYVRDEMRKLLVRFKLRFPGTNVEIINDFAIVYQKNMRFMFWCPVFSDFVNFDEYYSIEICFRDESKIKINVYTINEIFEQFEKFVKFV